MPTPWSFLIVRGLSPRKPGRPASNRGRPRSTPRAPEQLERRLALSITAFANADGSEPNNSLAGATDLGAVFGRRTEADLSIHSGTDEDWFKFILPVIGNKNDYVDVLFTHADGDLDALLYDTNENILASSRSNTDNERLSLDGLLPGTYCVRILGSNSAQNDNYSLVVQTHAYKPDRLEPNNAFPGRALGAILGVAPLRDLAISSFDDIDFYTFFLPYGGIDDSGIDIEFIHSAGDLDARLWDSLGQEIALSDSITDNEQLSLAGRPPGEYVLEVFGFDATNSYDIVFRTPAPPPTSGITINVDSLVANSDRPSLAGTIDDPTGTIFVRVGELEPLAIPNPGTGSWSLPGAALPEPLVEGDYPILAWTTNTFGDYAEDRGTLTVDLTAPTAAIAAVPPTRSTSLSTIGVTFTERVDGFDLADLFLTRDAVPVALTGVSITGSEMEYEIHGLDALTGLPGTYSLGLKAAESGIEDAAGNALAEDAIVVWTMRSTGPSEPGWVFLLGEASVAEFAVAPDGTTYVVGSFTGEVNFDPRSPSGILLSANPGETQSFVASYDESGFLLQVEFVDYSATQVSVAGQRIAIGGLATTANATSSVIDLFEISASERTLGKLLRIPLQSQRTEGTDALVFPGVTITELLLTLDGKVFVGGTLTSATMSLRGPGETSITLGVPRNQADGFIAAFSSAGEAAWVEPMLAEAEYVASVFPNSLAHEPVSGTLVLGAALTLSPGILPHPIPDTTQVATVIGLDAASGGYRWDASVIQGGLDAGDTVSVMAMPNGTIYAAAHAFVQAPGTDSISSKAGIVKAAVVTIDAGSGEAVAGPDLAELLGSGGDAYVSGLSQRPDESALLAITHFGSGGERSLSVLLLPPPAPMPQSPQAWSTPLNGFTRQLGVTGANRLVMTTSISEPTKFPVSDSSDGEEVVPSSYTAAIWSIADPFLPVAAEFNVPEGDSLTLTVPVDGEGAIVKKGRGALVLDQANTHSGGLIVQEGVVVIRHSQALNGGRLEVWDGARVVFDSESPDMGDANVPVSQLSLAATAGIDLQRAAIRIAADGFSAEAVHLAVLRGRNDGDWAGIAGITSSVAGRSEGSRSVGVFVSDDGQATVGLAAPGDTNLDRQVNVFDLVRINSSGTYGTGNPAGWSQGDFDYDGVTNVFDLVSTNSGGTYGTGPYTEEATLPGTVSLSDGAATPLVSPEFATAFAWLAEEQNKPSRQKPSLLPQ